MDGKDERRVVFDVLVIAGDFGLNGELRLLHLNEGRRLVLL